MTWIISILASILILSLLTLKKSRSDGDFIKSAHPYRKMMLHIMPGRNESLVFYDDYVVIDEMMDYLEVVNKRFRCGLQHLLVASVNSAMKAVPQMNRFVVGRRLYQRKHVEITFSMKRKKLNRQAKLAAVKKRIPSDMTLYELTQEISKEIKVERSEAVTYTDKEVGFFVKIPRPLMVLGVKIFKTLDYYNLLPANFIKNDGFYTSFFIANLGSIGMKAGYHHLYEWGNCPLFMMAGEIEERVFVENGEFVAKKVLPIRFTFDERTADGLTAGSAIQHIVDSLEHPFELLGCTKDDGSDDHPIGEPPADKQERLKDRKSKIRKVVAKWTDDI